MYENAAEQRMLLGTDWQSRSGEPSSGAASRPELRWEPTTKAPHQPRIKATEKNHNPSWNFSSKYLSRRHFTF
jgi:hypothetical protein